MLNGTAANYLQQIVLRENKNHSRLAGGMSEVELRQFVKPLGHAHYEVEIYGHIYHITDNSVN